MAATGSELPWSGGSPGDEPDLVALADYLAARDLADAAKAEPRVLAGGVSCDVYAFTAFEGPLVVKLSRAMLRVPDEWPAKRERVLTEAAAIRLLGSITPKVVPRVVDVDDEHLAFVMEQAPRSWVTWKQQLLAGTVDAQIAASLGETLGVWHAWTAGRDDVAAEFGDYEAFDQLRVDPYYRTTAERVPAVAGTVLELADAMAGHHECLVHGDYSPKNVLVGDGFWVLDFEVAHYGDPVFDLGFMLNHLFLKAAHRPSAFNDYRRAANAFLAGYEATSSPSLDDAYLAGHVAALMLARVVGKSPAEYLTGGEGARVAEFAQGLLLDRAQSINEVWDRMAGGE